MLVILEKGWKERQKVLFVVCDVFWAGWERVFSFFFCLGSLLSWHLQRWVKILSNIKLDTWRGVEEYSFNV